MTKPKKNKTNLFEKLQELSALQQKACLVLGVCAAVLLVTIISCMVLLRSWADPDEPQDQVDVSGVNDVITEDYDKDAYRLDESDDAILPESADAGEDYLKQTVFVGDSNTVRMYSYGLIDLDQFVGKVGLGIEGVLSDQCVYFKNDTTGYTIPDAIGKMKPRRIIMMMGTNNVEGAMTTDDFIAAYRKALNAIREAYSYSEIIVAAIPPVPADHSSYPNIRMQLIDEFNQALLQLCREDGYRFLNTSEALKNDNGFGVADYFANGDIHFTKTGINALLSYVRTHASDAEDKRPDTGSIPKRADTPKVESTSTPTAASYVASYHAEEGGSLSFNDKVDQKTLQFKVGESSSVTVVAVPKAGYSFYKWSDGVTKASRTDTNFTQAIDVTAMFNKLPEVGIKLNTGEVNMTKGADNTITATVTVDGKESDASNVKWVLTKADGTTSEAKGGSYKLKELAEGEYTLVASITANGTTQKAQCKITVKAKEKLEISLSSSSVEMTVGDKVSLQATVKGADGANVKWTGSNNAAEKTGASYDLSSLAVGEYTLTASVTSEGETVSTQCKVKVKKIPVTISLSATSIEMTQGDDKSIEATVNGADASKVTWTGAGNTATGSKFSLKSLAAGSYTIKASIEGVEARCSVVINPKPEVTISVSASASTLTEGESVTFTASVANADASGVQWSGAASGQGATLTVTGLTPGTHTVTATVAGKSASCTVTVNALPTPTPAPTPSPEPTPSSEPSSTPTPPEASSPSET